MIELPITPYYAALRDRVRVALELPAERYFSRLVAAVVADWFEAEDVTIQAAWLEHYILMRAGPRPKPTMVYISAITGEQLKAIGARLLHHNTTGALPFVPYLKHRRDSFNSPLLVFLALERYAEKVNVNAG